MSQVTWRAPDELVRRVQNAATTAGRSLNQFITVVLDAATDPDAVGDEAARVRERLALAGLLVLNDAARPSVDPAALAAAKARAGQGVSLVDLVTSDRG